MLHFVFRLVHMSLMKNISHIVYYDYILVIGALKRRNNDCLVVTTYVTRYYDLKNS